MASARGNTGLHASALIRATLLVVTGALIGCAGKVTNVLESDEPTPAEAGGAGGSKIKPGDPLWGCVDDPPESTSTEITNTTFQLVIVLGTGNVAGAKAALCKELDLDCNEPVARGQTGADGRVTLPIPDTFSGYVWFETADSATLYTLTGREFAHASGEDVPVQIMTPSALAQISALAGTPQKDGNGFVLASVFDCRGKPGANVRFDSNLEGSVFYAAGGIPTKGATRTDDSGYGGLINATPGEGGLKAIVDGRTVSIASFLVKPNATTVIQLRAGP